MLTNIDKRYQMAFYQSFLLLSFAQEIRHGSCGYSVNIFLHVLRNFFAIIIMDECDCHNKLYLIYIIVIYIYNLTTAINKYIKYSSTIFIQNYIGAL